MFNELYDSALEAIFNRQQFTGNFRQPADAKSLIVTASGTYYAAYSPNEEQIKIVKSDNGGFTWETLKILDYIASNGNTGYMLHLFFSEIEQKLYLAHNHRYTSPSVLNAFRFYNVTDDVNIDLDLAFEALDFKDNDFKMVGNVDTKIGVLFVNDVAGAFHFFPIDIHHFASGVRRINFVASVVVTGIEPGPFDISEDAANYYAWWIHTDGRLRQTTISKVSGGETYTIGGTVDIDTPTAGWLFTELFAKSTLIAYAEFQTGFVTGAKMHVADSVNTVEVTPGGTGPAQTDDSGFNYLWPFLVELDSSKYQLFYMREGSSSQRNFMTMTVTQANPHTHDTAQVVNDVASGLMDHTENVFGVPFLPQSGHVVESDSRRNLKVAISNLPGENNGHNTRSGILYTVGLYHIAYPLTAASFTISVTAPEHFSAGDVNRLTTKMHDYFENHGTNALIEKYEIGSASRLNSILGYVAPVEIETNVFINSLSLRNPTNIRIESVEDFADISEKDIRKVFIAPDIDLRRTYKKTGFGFVKRTVFLLWHYARWYEITQIEPIFYKGSIMCYKANLYVTGANYDPFSRPVLPNEN